MENTTQPRADDTIVVPGTKVSNPTKTSFGLDQFSKVTPQSARNFFDMYFIISKAVVGWLAAVHILSTRSEFVVTVTITLLLDVIVKGLTKMFGVTAANEAEP